MSLNPNPLYSLADINIIPCVLTGIESRKECSPVEKEINGSGEKLPIIVSPMSCNFLGNEEMDAMIYEHNNVNLVLPRTIEFSKRIGLCRKWMTAFSLNEAKAILESEVLREGEIINVCIDMANGHMLSQVETGKKLKEKFGDNIRLMGGNIANPKAYTEYDRAGFDYLRIGIGGGNACFTEDTMITMSDNSRKKISDIKVGDEVMTKNGPHKVIETFVNEVSQYFRINGNLKCTINHMFFAVDEEKVTENMTVEEFLKYGEWVEAYNLMEKKYRLVKYYNQDNIRLLEINSMTVEFARTSTGTIKVYNFEVDEEHTYLAEGYVVHNCLTSTQTGVHYPMASLIDEIRKIKGKTKIIADGGISGYSDIIKCLALGADYVMLGKIFTKAALQDEQLGQDVEYYGMSTKRAQAEMGNKELKTSEGRSLTLKKEYTLEGWVENFTDYLRTAMSYTDSMDLRMFKLKTECRVISPNSSYAINNK